MRAIARRQARKPAALPSASPDRTMTARPGPHNGRLPSGSPSRVDRLDLTCRALPGERLRIKVSALGIVDADVIRRVPPFDSSADEQFHDLGGGHAVDTCIVLGGDVY